MQASSPRRKKRRRGSLAAEKGVASVASAGQPLKTLRRFRRGALDQRVGREDAGQVCAAGEGAAVGAVDGCEVREAYKALLGVAGVDEELDAVPLGRELGRLRVVRGRAKLFLALTQDRAVQHWVNEWRPSRRWLPRRHACAPSHAGRGTRGRGEQRKD